MQIGKFTTQPAAEIKPLEEIRGLFVGRKGTGKSRAAISLRDCAPTKSALVIDIDNRKQSLRGEENVEVVSFSEKDGFEQLQDFLHECSKLVDKGLFQEKFCITLLSSITSVQTFLLKDSMNFIGDKPGSDGDKKGGAQKIGKMIVPGMRNYLYMASGVEEIILQQLFYLPGHLIIEGHLVPHWNDKNEIDGETILGTDKIAEKIPTFFNEVWKFAKEPGASANLPPEYVVHFRSNIADTTYPKLPARTVITNKRFYPELKRLLEK